MFNCQDRVMRKGDENDRDFTMCVLQTPNDLIGNRSHSLKSVTLLKYTCLGILVQVYLLLTIMGAVKRSSPTRFLARHV